ncbi:MAG TPA: STAS domain-containing protein [Candidatus Cybelea sp.]
MKLQPTQPETLDIFLVELVGDFDLSERERLIDAFALAKSALLVMVNLSKASYIDSAVLECLVCFSTATRKRGASFILLGVHGAVQRLFEICEMDKIFDIRGSDMGMAFAAARRVTVESRASSDG